MTKKDDDRTLIEILRDDIVLKDKDDEEGMGEEEFELLTEIEIDYRQQLKKMVYMGEMAKTALALLSEPDQMALDASPALSSIKISIGTLLNEVKTLDKNIHLQTKKLFIKLDDEEDDDFEDMSVDNIPHWAQQLSDVEITDIFSVLVNEYGLENLDAPWTKYQKKKGDETLFKIIDLIMTNLVDMDDDEFGNCTIHIAEMDKYKRIIIELEDSYGAPTLYLPFDVTNKDSLRSIAFGIAIAIDNGLANGVIDTVQIWPGHIVRMADVDGEIHDPEDVMEFQEFIKEMDVEEYAMALYDYYLES